MLVQVLDGVMLLPHVISLLNYGLHFLVQVVDGSPLLLMRAGTCSCNVSRALWLLLLVLSLAIPTSDALAMPDASRELP